jgi:hypothetical protein
MTEVGLRGVYPSFVRKIIKAKSFHSEKVCSLENLDWTKLS